MPRQSRGRSSAPRSAPAPAPAQTRSAHTAAAPAGYAAPAHHAPPPPAAAHAPPAQSQGPGVLASMAATAGSVAAGSVLGHGISNMLFGGSNHSAQATEAPAPAPPMQQTQTTGLSCEVQAKDFTKCLEKADLPSCQWYLDQLKACQAAAAPY